MLKVALQQPLLFNFSNLIIVHEDNHLSNACGAGPREISWADFRFICFGCAFIKELGRYKIKEQDIIKMPGRLYRAPFSATSSNLQARCIGGAGKYQRDLQKGEIKL